MSVNYANRGMSFEKLIEHANEQYKTKKWALIQKVPVPWKTFYNRKTKKSQAFPAAKSTVDFLGVANGKPIAFDAKSTIERKRFDLKNIESHQIEFLQHFQDQGGKAFFLIEFVKHQEVYILTVDDLAMWWKKALEGGRKSIPYHWFELNAKKVRSSRGIVLDYLTEL